MKIESIPSALPLWFDPSAPDYVKPKSWTGCRVRISVPVGPNPTKDLTDARIKLQSKFPGALLHLVPEFSKTSGPTQYTPTKGSDEDLLRAYFSTITLPAHVTIEQIIPYISKFIPSMSIFGSRGLRFKSVVAENVLCFEHCEMDLDLKGLTLVTGLNRDWDNHSNGSGKSSYTSLPFIALFGKSFKSQTHDEYASQFNDKTAKITLVMTLSDGRELKVVRQRRPGSLQAFLNGKEITMGRAEATQNLIEHLTNLTWSVLTNALYIGQSEIGSVFGTEKDRKELFSRLLGLERFLDAQVKLSKIALRIKKSAESIDTDIDMTAARISECRDTINILTSQFKAVPKVSKKEILRLDTEVNQIAESTNAKEKTLFQLALLREGLLKELQARQLKSSESLTRIQITRKTLSDSRNAKEKCHVCGSQVDAKVLKKYQGDLVFQIEKGKKALEIFEREESKLSKQVDSIRNQERSLVREIKELNDSGFHFLAQLERLRSQVNEQDRLTKMISEKQARIKSLEKTKLVHEQAKQATLEEKQFVDICVNAVSRNGLPAYLCESVVPQLNQTAQHYSEVFADGEIGVQFSASNGDVDVNICNLHGGKLTKDQSAGEMRIAAIITAFTFRDSLLPLNLLIVDEPSEGLDPTNSLAFAKGLTQVLSRFEHVIIISHNSNVLGSLEPDRRIEIIKEHGISSACIVTP